MNNGVKLIISANDNRQMTDEDVKALTRDLFEQKMVDLPWAVLEEDDIDFAHPREMVRANFEARFRGEDKWSLMEAIDKVTAEGRPYVVWFSGLNWDNYQIHAPLERRGYYNGNLFVAMLQRPRAFETEAGTIAAQQFIMLHGNRTAESLQGTPVADVLQRYFGRYSTATQRYTVKVAT